MCAMYTRLCLTLCDAMDCNPPSSSVHGIFQARILEWVAISYSRGSSPPRDQIQASCISCNSRQILYHSATWKVCFWAMGHQVNIQPQLSVMNWMSSDAASYKF